MPRYRFSRPIALTGPGAEVIVVTGDGPPLETLPDKTSFYLILTCI
ncbi:MAG TPA: hypothetical protein VE135_17250 [Pyrinomonadaceae bacterium]|nr:hypothetical protein [Pyrinomonadaceae bacterium]